MANTLTTLIPTILAAAQMALREMAIMPRLVFTDFDDEAAAYGNTINVPLPAGTASTSAVTPAAVPPTPASSVPLQAQIQLSHWKKTNFHLTDKERREVDARRHFIPMAMSDAVRVMAQDIDATVHATYTSVYGYTGTAGTTPFASTTADAVNVRKILNTQLAPGTPRNLVLDPDAMANALVLSQLADLEKTGDRDVKIEGEMGRKLGQDWFETTNIVTHTAGTAATITVASTTAAGETSVKMTASTNGTLVVGDIISVAGNTQTYVVTTLVTVTTGTAVVISPALVATATATDVVTLRASHVVNLGFHPNAFAFVSRPLADGDLDLGGSRQSTIIDPVSGVAMRLEVGQQYKQVAWELDACWGAACIRPALACRLGG